MQTKLASGRTLAAAAALGGVLLVALLLRVSTGASALSGEQVQLTDAESHLHAWRIDRARELLPLAASAPAAHGQVQHRPPPPASAFHLLGATLATVLGLPPGQEQEARLATLLCSYLAALGVLLATWIAWRLTRLPWAVLAGLLLAGWPIGIELSRVGRINPQSAEPLLLALSALLVLRPSASRRAWIPPLLAGTLLGLCLWSYPGAPPTVLISALALCAGSLMAPKRARGHLLALCSCTAVTLPLALTAPPQAASLQHMIEAPSPALLLLLLLLCTTTLGATLLHRGQRRAALLCSSLVLAGVALAAARWPVVHTTAALALEGHHASLLRTPVWSLPLPRAVILLSYTAVALPVLVGCALRRRRTSHRRSGVSLLALWSGGLMLAGAAQVRYLPAALALATPLAALGLARLHAGLLQRLRRHARPTLRRSFGPLLGMGALCLHWPLADYLDQPRWRDAPPAETYGVEQAARWLRRHPPAGAVLAQPWAAPALLHLGRVRVVGADLMPPLLSESSRIAMRCLTTGSVPRARDRLRQRRVSHVLSSRFPTPRYAAYRYHLGRSTSRLQLFRTHRRTLAARLYHDVGSGAALANDFLPAVGWAQLQWESRPRLGRPSALLFRTVPGARLRVATRPHVEVSLELKLISNRGRPLTYRDRRLSSHRGLVRFTVPYWSSRTVPAEVTRYLRRLEQVRQLLASGRFPRRPLQPLNRKGFTPLGRLQLSRTDRAAALLDINRAQVLGAGVLRISLEAAAGPAASRPTRR